MELLIHGIINYMVGMPKLGMELLIHGIINYMVWACPNWARIVNTWFCTAWPASFRTFFAIFSITVMALSRGQV